MGKVGLLAQHFLVCRMCRHSIILSPNEIQTLDFIIPMVNSYSQALSFYEHQGYNMGRVELLAQHFLVRRMCRHSIFLTPNEIQTLDFIIPMVNNYCQ